MGIVQVGNKAYLPATILESKVLSETEDEGIVEAYVNVYGVEDLGDDVVHFGMFAKSIAERGPKVRVLDHHNTNSITDILGKPLEIREVKFGELPSEVKSKLSNFSGVEGALYTRTKFNLKNPKAQVAFDLYKAGDADEWSIGFEVVKQDFENRKEGDKVRTIRHLREGKLWEYSPVIWGMNQATITGDVKNDPTVTNVNPVSVSIGDPPGTITTSTTTSNIKVDVSGTVTPVTVDPTPDDEKGMLKIGRYFDALINNIVNGEANWLYRCETLDREEKQTLIAAGEAACLAFLNALPEEIAGRPLYGDDEYWSARQENITKLFSGHHQADKQDTKPSEEDHTGAEPEVSTHSASEAEDLEARRQALLAHLDQLTRQD